MENFVLAIGEVEVRLSITIGCIFVTILEYIKEEISGPFSTVVNAYY